MIHLKLPSVPISVNQAYAKKRGSGARILTKKGKKYKNETKAYIAKHYPGHLQYFQPNHPYVIVVEFTFKDRETLYTKGWDDPNSPVESRYKTLDVGNRLKLFEDALASATAVDDKHNFVILLSKTWHRDFESTELWVWNRELEPNNPVDELLRTLRGAQPH